MTFGIDVSHFQGAVSWTAARRDGVEFAFAKATEGTGFTDARLRGNLAGMKAAGILPGAYHFMQPGSGVAQCDHFSSVVGNPEGMLIALDVEAGGIRFADVKAWRDRWQALHPGHPVFVYTGRDLWARVIGEPADSSGLGPLWAAGRAPNVYGDSQGFGLARSWAFWRTSVSHPPFSGWDAPTIVQWTENVRVAGVPTPCDGDHTDLTVTQLRTYATSGGTDMPLTAAEIDAVARAAAAAVHGQQIYRQTDPDGTPLTIAEAILRTYQRSQDPALLAKAVADAVVTALSGQPGGTFPLTAAEVQTACENAVRKVFGSLAPPAG